MTNHQPLKYLIFVFLITLLLSCASDNTDQNQFIYFNLSDFIENESKRLSALKSGVDKTVFLNGETEKKSTQISNWNSELSAFTEADINKKSFLGKYQVDSIQNEDHLLVRYSTHQENFRTKELAIQYGADNKPARIIAIMETSNILYSSRQELVYEPGKGYSISGKQIIRFLEPDSFYVNARFDNL